MKTPETMTRRGVLRLGGGVAAGAVLGGCGRVRALWPRRGELKPFAVPGGEGIGPVAHVLNRLTWGAGPGDYERVRAMGGTEEEAAAAFVEEQLKPEMIEDGYARAACAPLEAIRVPVPELFEYKPAQLDDELTRRAVIRAVHSERQLYEVMVGFWSDHFNIDASKLDCQWFKCADDREVIRKHAMGSFREMLKASALSPAMLFYLDGRKNRKDGEADRPNENYARELLELHTMGVGGGYSQEDVMEAARCLTGWTVTGREVQFGIGRVYFDARGHDDGRKVVLGKEIPAGGGAGDLDRLLDILMGQEATGKFLAEKLCRHFIADEAPSGAVAVVAEAFRASGGGIREMLRALFGTEEFRAARGEKIKRPFHFVVSALRATGSVTTAGGGVKRALLVMGHVPFHYPTPEGPAVEGSAWLATLLHRWDFAAKLTVGGIGCSRNEPEKLVRCAGGVGGMLGHCFGRRATAEEVAAAETVAEPVALALAAPAFQVY